MNISVKFQETLAPMNDQYGVKVFSKDQKWVWLWRVIDLLTYFMLTKKSDKKCSDRFDTIIGPYIFFTNGWRVNQASDVDCVTLKHELVHLKWMRFMGLGNLWLGALVFNIFYFFLFLPVGLAYFRYRAERVAYVATYKEGKKLGIKYDTEHFVNLLTGPSYLWAWPFKKSVRKYFKKHCA